MLTTPSALETLAAFAITFVTGALASSLVTAYGAMMKEEGRQEARNQ